MRVRHWLFGCAVCFAGIGTAAATSVDSRDLDGSAHAAGDASGASESNAGGDLLRLNREASPRGTSSESTTSSSHGTSGDHTGPDSSAPSHTPQQQPHLGWQSLLPGSIQ
jgi:hypothetical protein